MRYKKSFISFFAAFIWIMVGKSQEIANHTVQNKIKVLTNTTSPACPFELNEDEAKTMLKYYDQLFDTDGLTKEFWMSKCLINALANFLVDNPACDGINLSFGATKKFLGKWTSKLIIVPTTESNPQTPKKKHKNEWGKKISIPTNCNADENIILNDDGPKNIRRINEFGEKFRGETTSGNRESAKKGPLSSAIWIKACTIKEINAILQAKNLDGLRAMAASYYKSDDLFRRGERQYEIQSTLIFIPTINKKIDWRALDDMKLLNKKKTDEVYNHGQLCPQICD